MADTDARSRAREVRLGSAVVNSEPGVSHMLGLVLLYLGPILLIAAVIGWFGARSPRSVSPALISAAPSDDQDLIPRTDYAAGEDRLAVFYAYQMAISRIDRD